MEDRHYNERLIHCTSLMWVTPKWWLYLQLWRTTHICDVYSDSVSSCFARCMTPVILMLSFLLLLLVCRYRVMLMMCSCFARCTVHVILMMSSIFSPGARPQQDSGVQERLCHAQVLHGAWKTEKSVALHPTLSCLCH